MCRSSPKVNRLSNGAVESMTTAPSRPASQLHRRSTVTRKARACPSSEACVREIFRTALCRNPSPVRAPIISIDVLYRPIIPTPAGPSHMAIHLLRTMEQSIDSTCTPPSMPVVFTMRRYIDVDSPCCMAVGLKGQQISFIYDATTAEPLFLCNEPLVEIVAVVAVGGTEIEIALYVYLFSCNR